MNQAFIKTGGPVLLFVSVLLPLNAYPQQRFDSGPQKGFVREEPELTKVEIPKPFRVRTIKGTVVYSGRTPLPGALFEIRDDSGRIRSAAASQQGTFRIPDVPPGTYVFKATKNGYHSVIGTIVVSPKAARSTSIRIQLPIGT